MTKQKQTTEELINLIFTINGKDMEIEVTQEIAEHLYQQLREELLYK